MNNNQIKHMVDRFLGWKLPENFNPDAGISFRATFNEHTSHPMRHEPSGTNLFDAAQTDAMVRYLVEGLPAPISEEGDLEFEPVNMDQALGVLADIVAAYVSSIKMPVIEDQKKGVAIERRHVPAQPPHAGTTQRRNGEPCADHRRRAARGFRRVSF